MSASVSTTLTFGRFYVTFSIHSDVLAEEEEETLETAEVISEVDGGEPLNGVIPNGGMGFRADRRD